jgi:hypothetical protein
MEQHEVPYGGVYRLMIDGQLVGEFVPGPLWTEIHDATTAAHENVTYSWVPFGNKSPSRELEKFQEAMTVARAALESAEAHVPVAEGSTSEWIQCSCGTGIRPHYWTRHSQGADGSAIAPRPLQRVKDILDTPSYAYQD